jgi:hypothetical protein
MRPFQCDAYGSRILDAGGNNLLYKNVNVTQEISATSAVANRTLVGTDEYFMRSDFNGSYSPITDLLGGTVTLVICPRSVNAHKRRLLE